ncbi:G-protein coupled receptor 52 [Octopus bimaculoides]|uniref:G-protein coupled receptors family 1 profile domain-containing protein n=1 Tax=Octopus bimaculoides TaxID=37653 RepID=A0A0L8GAV2_OCTBM|nr:G-protein coupled receptor 52 [Octopus bimaculoides]XP_014782614.1 G-protein coupled receptor 52 [Octopus bimaculoides]XP_052833321.1 G-protein coupled receptor 52 [Octopus bimaculoides]|eukprot:XP_014782613.1 PREDICTED: probable G-protein coupled receptor 52 [Octopus bimaculoides]
MWANSTDDPENFTKPNWIHMTIMIAVTVLILLSSLFTLAVIVYSNGYRSLQGIFMICIASSNLLVGVLVTPVGIFLSQNPDYQTIENICPVSCTSLLWSVTFVLYCIGFMALEKYFKIKLSITYVNRIRPLYGWIVACLTAVGSAFVVALPIKLQGSEMFRLYSDTSFLCIFSYQGLGYISTPAILLNIGSHLALGQLVRHIKRNPNQMCPSMPRRLNRDLTAAKTISISLGIFLCSYIPATVCIFLRQYVVVDIPKPVFFGVTWLTISNNFFISILYYQHNSVFRYKAQKLIQVMCNPCQSLFCSKTNIKGLWTFTDVNDQLSL